MPTNANTNQQFPRLHDVLKVDAAKLSKLGVFNGFVDIDSPVYIDPRLLGKCSHPEFAKSRSKLDVYFENIFKLIRGIKQQDDPFWREAHRRLKFKENNKLSLGLSSGDSHGHGIGDGLATEILLTARHIIAIGIDDTTIFELMSLFNKGIGPDLISDMISRVIYGDILAFSERVAKELKIPTVNVTHAKVTYTIAMSPITGGALPFLPFDILSDIPIAENWSDRDIVAAQNQELRDSFNEVIGNSWKSATNKLKKDELRKLLFKNPELLKDLLHVYKKKVPAGYDFANDPEGYFSWENIAVEVTAQHPLKFETSSTGTLRVTEFANTLCLHFKRLLENNGLSKVLYKEGTNTRRKEEFLQLLFLAIGITYAEHYGFKLTREPNSGHGPVDFQVSMGAAQVVNIELKFSDHRLLKHGWEQQVEIYNKAENTSASIYFVAQVTKYDPPQLKEIRKLIATPVGTKRPRLIVADCVLYPSASKKQDKNIEPPDVDDAKMDDPRFPFLKPKSRKVG